MLIPRRYGAGVSGGRPSSTRIRRGRSCRGRGARRPLGSTDVWVWGATEVAKPGAPPPCIRILLHWNTSRRQDEIVHVYLRGSDAMRPQDPPSHLARALPPPARSA